MRFLSLIVFIPTVFAGRAPSTKPKLPEGFCKHGDITATTGGAISEPQFFYFLLKKSFFFNVFPLFFFLLLSSLVFCMFFESLLKPMNKNNVYIHRMHVSLATQKWVCRIQMSVSNGSILVSLYM